MLTKQIEHEKASESRVCFRAILSEFSEYLKGLGITIISLFFGDFRKSAKNS